MKNVINEIKNTLEATNSRITEAEDSISKLEDRMIEIKQSERIKEKQIKRNEDNLRNLQDNIKHYNIRIIGVPEEEDKKKDHKKILEEIIVENFPKMGTELITQVQETQRVPNRINAHQTKQKRKIGNLPDKEFQIMIVKLIQNLEIKMESQIKSLETKIDKMQERFTKDVEEKKRERDRKST